MKILISNDCGKSAHFFQRLGLARALTACGYECVLWDINSKSIYDAFDEANPDIFIGQTYTITPALIECIKERPALKVILKASDWGPITEKVAEKFPILVANKNERNLVDFMTRETGKPDGLFIHYHPDYLKDTHGYWSDQGYNVFSDMNAADIFEYTKGEYKEKYTCDVGYVGGNWGYKSQVLNPYILPLCETFRYNIKIFGNGWSVPQAMGFLPEGQEKDFYQSAKINICLHEPHSHAYGFDVTEKFFKLAINKAFTICDYVVGLEKSYGRDTIFSVKSAEQLHFKIYEMLNDWDNYSLFRQEIVENAYKQTLEKHTYFDRVANIFNNLGLSQEAQKVYNKKKEIVEKMGL